MDLKIFIYLTVVVVISEARVVQPPAQRIIGLQPSQQGCEIDINRDLTSPQPLLLNGASEYLLPDWNTTDGRIFLAKDERITLYCSSQFKFINETEVTAKCIRDQKFLISNDIYLMDELSCRSHPKQWNLLNTDSRDFCINKSLTEIGFNVSNQFLPLMKVCHTKEMFKTFYVIYEQSPRNLEHQHRVGRPSFTQLKFHFPRNIKVDYLYKTKTQLKTFMEILQSEELAKELTSGKLILSRGHLAAKSDFILGNHQRATYNFINIAPQFQSFNSGNWQRIEIATKKFIASRQLNCTVITGVHDVLSVPSNNGTNVDLYLYVNGTNRGIPVPKYYYKILIEESSKSGIAFIGVNYPLLTETTVKNYILCEDISEDINWIKLDHKKFSTGYSYACLVNDFFRNLPQGLLPSKYNVTELLK